MPQATEPRSSSLTSSSMQDAFLNQVRRARADIIIHMMDGRSLGARIKAFDKFAVVIEGEAGDQLIFKHAIASIESTLSITGAMASQT